MTLRIPIGIDDFRELRELHGEYVDKTSLIRELLDRPTVKVSLLPRPRRFGKSLNLSMLRCFFEKRREDLWHLFEGLEIARTGEEHRAHFQKYPVVHLSFKAVRAETLEICLDGIRDVIRALYREHIALLDHPRLDPWEKADFTAILSGTASEALYRRSLSNLASMLHRTSGERVVVLIDEYDAPIHAGWAHGYDAAIVEVFRGFFEAGLKDNPHLFKGVLTGVLRVSKESIFSGLNNIKTYSILDPEMHTCFGFTEPEVAALLAKAGVADLLPAVRGYYNGYVFGGEPIYNPWSILHFVASPTRQLVPHWVTTSANELVKRLLEQHAFAVHRDLEVLLSGGSIEKRIDDNIVFAELRQNEEALWSLLVFSGYLRAEPGPVTAGRPRPPERLSIPNQEVAEVYRRTFQSWLEQGLRKQGGAADELHDALLAGDAGRLEKQLQHLATHLTSFHDAAGGQVHPERFYHGLVLGLLAGLEPDYEVRSNRESGSGRPDLWVKPRRAGRPGVVLELKVAEPGEKALVKALREGLQQIRKGDYEAELRAAGAEPVHALAVAFDGKRVRVEAASALANAKPAKKRRAATGTRAPRKKTRKSEKGR